MKWLSVRQADRQTKSHNKISSKFGVLLKLFLPTLLHLVLTQSRAPPEGYYNQVKTSVTKHSTPEVGPG